MNNLKTKNINEWMGGLEPEMMSKISSGETYDVYFVPSLTPEAARYLLNRKPHPESKLNRPLDPRHVKEYELKIKNNHFAVNGDPIRFDWFGSLQDGQHRLHAIANTGISIPNQHFVAGIDPEAFSTIDTGMVKKDKDIFYAMGVSNPTKISPMIALHRKWFGLNNPNDWKEVDEKYIALTTRASTHDAQYFAKLFYLFGLSETQKNALQEAIRITKNTSKNLIVNGGQWAGARCLAFSVLKAGNSQSSAAIQSFFNDLSNEHPQNWNPNFPVKRLINKIKSEMKLVFETKYKFDPSMRNELLIKAWNAYASNELLYQKDVEHYTGKVPKIKVIGAIPYTKKKIGNR